MKKTANLMIFLMKMTFKKFLRNHQIQQFHLLLHINLMKKLGNVQLRKQPMNQKKLRLFKMMNKMKQQLNQSLLKRRRFQYLKFVKLKMLRWDSRRKSLHIYQHVNLNLRKPHTQSQKRQTKNHQTCLLMSKRKTLYG